LPARRRFFLGLGLHVRESGANAATLSQEFLAVPRGSDREIEDALLDRPRHSLDIRRETRSSQRLAGNLALLLPPGALETPVLDNGHGAPAALTGRGLEKVHVGLLEFEKSTQEFDLAVSLDPDLAEARRMVEWTITMEHFHA
jgi:hypothetical protein